MELAFSRALAVRRISNSAVSRMRLVQLQGQGGGVAGIAALGKDGQVLLLNKADPSLPKTLIEVLKNGALDKCKQASLNAESVPLSSVKLTAPVTGGDKVIGVGLNYRGHCEEQKLPIPPEPIFFSKFPSCIVGPEDAVQVKQNITKSVDWEVELAVIIGKEARDVPKEKAMDYVAGYCVAQDISARDWQKTRNGGQFLLGKSMDTFCPMGPALVTKDEVADPHNLNIQCSIDGVLKQRGNTNELIYRIDDVIHRLSIMFALLPGDIILTGTPSGVGAHRKPPEFLTPGQKINSVIETIGEINNPVTAYVPRQ